MEVLSAVFVGESSSFLPELYVHIEDTFLSDDMKDTVDDESDSDTVHKIVVRACIYTCSFI